ncbi:hypothetical protein GCM10010363_00790 [Streptomyces omiyaensis]|uniref:hypothetical protein n=1 Tax=Streptomyces omiyaensis TaxID=68247 RepID=UPI0016726353|nr:hypothetical protein [Streptomyces omiyaensis]GGY24524.1 hypothetical protein GCM10010363_00790 [Streptomyces omiyaensis]
MTTQDAPGRTASSRTAPSRTASSRTASSRTALRVLAGVGLLLAAVCAVATAVVTLDDAVSGDGSGGMLVAAGFWAVGLAHPAGVAALVVPRRALVAAEYALAFAGPVLALMD